MSLSATPRDSERAAMITYTCAKCRAPLETDEGSAETKEPCPLCGYLNRVPKTRGQRFQEWLAREKAQRADAGS